MKSGLFKAVAVIALLGGTPALAATKTYDMAEITSDFAITGSIVTDGNFGVLTQADILSWNLAINFFGVGVTHVIGPTSVPLGRVAFQGSALTADNFGLFWNFNDASGSMEFQLFDQSNHVSLVDLETGVLLAQVQDIFGHSHTSFITPSGNLQFAIDPTAFDAIATPLPAALPLFATGLGVLGLLGWRRKRRA